MAELLAKAATRDFHLESSLLRKITQVCATTAWGYREILLVICIARLLEPSYRPTTSLYACNPRALYEGPIREMLYEAGIPHRKSGPLNIAKATPGINRAWAAQRRPGDIAETTVDLADWIENSDPESLRSFGAALLSELLREATRVADYNIAVQEEADIAHLEHLCWELINETPDAGNTPQRIVGLLLVAYHRQIHSDVTVEGHAERASTTSTTSKKPGDIMERDKAGGVIVVYEVTVKPFDEQRTSDSADSILEFSKATGTNVLEILVLCRDSDLHPNATRNNSNSMHLATLLFRGLTYQFLDLHEWLTAAVSRLTPQSRIEFYKDLNDYIADVNTAEKVKSLWKELHSKS